MKAGVILIVELGLKANAQPKQSGRLVRIYKSDGDKMVEKTVSGRVRTKSPSSPRFKRQRVKKEKPIKLPSLSVLKRNAQRKINLINDNEYVSEIIEDNYYKTLSINGGKLIVNMVYKDYEIRNELMDFMRQMNEII